MEYSGPLPELLAPDGIARRSPFGLRPRRSEAAPAITWAQGRAWHIESKYGLRKPTVEGDNPRGGGCVRGWMLNGGGVYNSLKTYSIGEYLRMSIQCSFFTASFEPGKRTIKCLTITNQK